MLSRRLSKLDFAYTDPTSNFDRSKVKGLVAELITLDKEQFNASTALEICAGGRLYNVRGKLFILVAGLLTSIPCLRWLWKMRSWAHNC